VSNTHAPRNLLHVYGPTESTTFATFYRVERYAGEQAPPIGRPISNTQVYVLDERLQPVPIGVVGEICIGGAGIARGYLNRPELTVQRFVADPFRGDGPAGQDTWLSYRAG
jgi:non-ribosomal peptide synthetase component F